MKWFNVVLAHTLCINICTHADAPHAADVSMLVMGDFRYSMCAQTALPLDSEKICVSQTGTKTTLYPAVISQHKLTYESRHCIRSHQMVSCFKRFIIKYKSPLDIWDAKKSLWSHFCFFDDSFCLFLFREHAQSDCVQVEINNNETEKCASKELQKC